MVTAAVMEKCLTRHVIVPENQAEFHDDVRKVFDLTSKEFVILPPLAYLEAQIAEVEESLGDLPPEVNVIKYVQRNAGDQKSHLLSMQLVRKLCGLDFWNFAEQWSKSRPCNQWLSSFSGMVVTPDHQCAVSCGTTVWCPTCAEQYKHYVEGPSVFLYRGLFKALLLQFLNHNGDGESGLVRLATI
jgi:hypothetical protein